MRVYLVGQNANNKFAVVDKQDFDLVKGYKWYSHGKTGYAYTKIKSKSVLMHRLILNAPPDKLVDHKDNNRLNNRRSNIRICTKYENNIYRDKNADNKSGYKGVVFTELSKRNPWVVYYSCNGKHFNGGSYPTKEKAALAYNKIIKELHGQFAYLNQIRNP